MSKEAETLSPMQQELLNRADSIINSIGTVVGKASDLAVEGGKAVAEQIPDIAMQYILYGRASLTAYVVLAIVLAVLSYYLVVKIAIQDVKKMGTYSCDSWSDGRISAMAIGLLAGLTSLITFIHSIKSFFLVWFAPKIWLLIEIVDLVKMVKG